MKFAAHQTFHLRASWPYKGLRLVGQDSEAIFKDNAIEKLGMGKNMVESLRYWLEATQLVTKKGAEMRMTKIASEMFEKDPYFELDGSLQLIHYLLASNKESATTWHWFFNKFSASEFDSDSLNIYLQSYILANTEKSPKEKTLAKDINCLLRMYCAEEYDKKNDPETNSPSPFSKFRWIEKYNDKYIRRRLRPDEIEPLIFIYSLYHFWMNCLGGIESISIEDIADKENAPGPIFGLSLEKCAEMIDSIGSRYRGKYLEHNRSGGYFIINMKRSAGQALKDYYKSNQMLVEAFQ